MYVTTQGSLGFSRCPTTVTKVPTTGTRTEIPGGTHKGRSSIHSHRSAGSHILIRPEMANRRGSGSPEDGADVATEDLAIGSVRWVGRHDRHVDNPRRPEVTGCIYSGQCELFKYVP